MQFLYSDGTDAHFMDTESFEQIAVVETTLADMLRWTKPSSEVDVLFIDDEPSDVQLPSAVDLEVTQTDPGLRGDTASGGRNEARDAGDGREHPGAAVRGRGRAHQGRHALRRIHLARLRRCVAPSSAGPRWSRCTSTI